MQGCPAVRAVPVEQRSLRDDAVRVEVAMRHEIVPLDVIKVRRLTERGAGHPLLADGQGSLGGTGPGPVAVLASPSPVQGTAAVYGSLHRTPGMNPILIRGP
jgi:hypothetical protein